MCSIGRRRQPASTTVSPPPTARALKVFLRSVGEGAQQRPGPPRVLVASARAVRGLELGDAEPGCRYFSHSFRFLNCILCASCDSPEIMLGDDTYASFQRVSEDESVLRTGVLAR